MLHPFWIRDMTDFLTVDTDKDENELSQLDKVKEELLKNAVFLEIPVEESDVLPVTKKAILNLGALISLKKSTDIACWLLPLRMIVSRKRSKATFISSS